MPRVMVRRWDKQDEEAIAELRKATARADVTDDGLIVVEPPPDALFSGPPQPDYALVVQDDEGRILATVQPEPEIGPEQSFIWSFPLVHPEARGTSIELLLLERLWQRASERRAEMPSESVYLHVNCGAHQGERIALNETFALRLMRQRPHMVYQPLDSLPSPEAPSRIQLRPYCRGADDESAVQTLNEAFAEDWEYVPVSAEGWSLWLDAPPWRADLSLVAADGDQVVGLCLCIVNEERMQWLGRRDGYVDTLCVRPSHQRKGLGAALLLAGLHALREAGMASATLDTDEDNPTQAARLYEGVGFREIWRWSAYGSEL